MKRKTDIRLDVDFVLTRALVSSVGAQDVTGTDVDGLAAFAPAKIGNAEVSSFSDCVAAFVQ